MPIFAQTATTAPLAPSAVLVGAGHLVLDRPLDDSYDYPAFALVARDGAYWRPLTAARVDAPAWAADTATALGDIVRPATRPVTTAKAGSGNGTLTAVASASARAGLYEAVCVAAAANGGTFRLKDPTGRDLGAVPVGTATALGGLTLTIADGSTDWAVGERVFALVGALHAYAATAVAGDTKTHATTEPTWPTNGATVTDDQVTWTDLGVVDDSRDFSQWGVLHRGEALSVAASAHPTLPLILSGAVARDLVAGLPAAYAAGDRLGDLLLA